MDILLFFSLIFETVSLCNSGWLRIHRAQTTSHYFLGFPSLKTKQNKQQIQIVFAPYTEDKGPVQWAEMITILNQAQSTH